VSRWGPEVWYDVSMKYVFKNRFVFSYDYTKNTEAEETQKSCKKGPPNCSASVTQYMDCMENVGLPYVDTSCIIGYL
jgi:hypothetical protein